MIFWKLFCQLNEIWVLNPSHEALLPKAAGKKRRKKGFSLWSWKRSPKLILQLNFFSPWSSQKPVFWDTVAIAQWLGKQILAPDCVWILVLSIICWMPEGKLVDPFVSPFFPIKYRRHLPPGVVFQYYMG